MAILITLCTRTQQLILIDTSAYHKWCNKGMLIFLSLSLGFYVIIVALTYNIHIILSDDVIHQLQITYWSGLTQSTNTSNANSFSSNLQYFHSVNMPTEFGYIPNNYLVIRLLVFVWNPMYTTKHTSIYYSVQ